MSERNHAWLAMLGSAFIGMTAMFASWPAHAAELVVIEARGIGFRPGQTLDADKPLVLKEGQHVTLITAEGATLKLDGPYDKAPAADRGQGVSVQAALAALVTQRQARTSEVGTTRGVIAAKLPQPWLLDASRSGNVCLRDGQAPVFWRPDAARASTLSVMPSDRSWKADTQWPAGRQTLSVPLSDLPLHGGASYFVALDRNETAIKVNAIPSVLANDAMRAAWMAEKGCEAQAEALLRSEK